MNEVNNGNTFEKQYVYLMENIDLTGETWDVIGSYTDDTTNKAFAGIFEGNNRTINGLNINKNQDFVGLFVYNTGIIRDIILESGTVTGVGRVGGIVAVNSGLIENCHNKGVTINLTGNSTGGGGICARSTGEITYCSNLVDINSEAGYVGGITGSNNNEGKVSRCYNEGEIEAVYDVGGITGGNDSKSSIGYCYNLGYVLGTGIENETNRETYVGGISGNNFGKIKCCYNLGNVRCEVSQAGGIVGNNIQNGEINTCYNIGTIEENGIGIGNIVGVSSSATTINNCYFNREISNLEGVGMIFGNPEIEIFEKTSNYMKTNSFVNDLNKEEEAFTINSNLNNGYPILKWQCE